MMHTKLIDKTELAPRLFLLRFQKPEGYAHKPGQFARLGLEADVDQDLVLVDLRHGAAHEIALVEVGNGTVDEIVHLLIIHVV